MENFLVFRCSRYDELKLVYFMTALGCDIPILEALFYTTMGFYAWPGNDNEAFTMTCVRRLKIRIEELLNIKLVFILTEDICCEEKLSFEHTITLGWNVEIFENVLHLVVINELRSGGSIDLFIEDWTQGKLQISVTKGREIQSQQAFRFGQIDATIDTHLALLFKC